MFYCFVIRKKVIAAFLLVLLFCSASIPIYCVSIADSREGIPLPVIMYHSVLKNTGPEKYIISVSEFENDMKYLKENGYTAVMPSDLVKYVYEGQPLPEKPVMITFDDGFLNNASYAVPILQENGMKGVISIVGSYTERYSENPDRHLNYSYLTWEDIRELNESGIIEIGNHTYDMHGQNERKGCKKKKGESKADYKAALTADIGRLQKDLADKSGVNCTIFTYPFGAISNDSVDIIRDMGFRVSFSCTEKVRNITNDPECLYQIGRKNRSGKLSTKEFMKKIEN